MNKGDILKVQLLMLATFFLCASTLAADAPAKRGFEQVPKQALVELKATIGKPFTAGLVFIDGKFIPPPYKVERYGTAFRINGQQVTGQIIRWDEFLKTQNGVRVEQVDAPATTEAPAPVATVPETPSTPSTETSNDISDDFDDLFDDNPKPKKKARAAVKKDPVPAAPTTKVVFSGEFTPNQRSRALLDKLNKARTDMEIMLRKGGAYFFGTRYSTITADRGPTDMFLATMPTVMKENSTYESFSAAARAKGITYLSETVLRDLFRNRLDYIQLQNRAKLVKEERKWETMLNTIQ
jgi:hypothetical protein